MQLRDVAVISVVGLVVTLCLAGCEAPAPQSEVPESVYATDHLGDFDTVYDPETNSYVPRESVEVVPEAEPALIDQGSWEDSDVEIQEVEPYEPEE